MISSPTEKGDVMIGGYEEYLLELSADSKENLQYERRFIGKIRKAYFRNCRPFFYPP